MWRNIRGKTESLQINQIPVYMKFLFKNFFGHLENNDHIYSPALYKQKIGKGIFKALVFQTLNNGN